MKLVIMLLAILMAGCASTLTEEEQQAKADATEWKKGIDYENYRMCMLMYDQAGVQTIHIDHQHDRRSKKRGPRWSDVKSDLMYNECRRHLKEYWADY